MDRHLLGLGSDYHLPGAERVSLEHLAALGVDEIVHVGDRCAKPDYGGGPDYLRDAKVMAKQGLRGGESPEEVARTVEAAEAQLWQEHEGILVPQWLGVIERTREIHRHAERFVGAGTVPQMADVGGNDEQDIGRRVRYAQELYRTRTGEQPEEDLIRDIVAPSPAFRPIDDVRRMLVGPTYVAMVPYPEDKPDATLAGYEQAILAGARKARGTASTALLLVHQNPNPETRRESRTSWVGGLGELVQSELPGAEIVMVHGHDHTLREPYEHRGMLVVPNGWYGADKSRAHIQRVTRIDLHDPGDRSYSDLVIAQHGPIEVVRNGTF